MRSPRARRVTEPSATLRGVARAPAMSRELFASGLFVTAPLPAVWELAQAKACCACAHIGLFVQHPPEYKKISQVAPLESPKGIPGTALPLELASWMPQKTAVNKVEIQNYVGCFGLFEAH